MEMSTSLSRGIKRANPRVHAALLAAKPEETKANYLDISHVEGEVSFLPANRQSKSPYKTTNLRTSGKPLRILKKFVKTPADPWIDFGSFDMSFNNVTEGSFMNTHERNNFMKQLTDRDWENFLYALRPTLQEVPLTLVEGEDIRKYYHERNYSPDQTLTTLHRSCMRHESCQVQMDFYVQNPNVKMLVELDDNKKVRGRAIVWTLTNGEVYMDRVYGSEVTTQIFRQYADKQGWFHRTFNTYTNLTSITNSEGKKLNKSMAVPRPNEHNNMPWMDTFKYTMVAPNGSIVLTNDRFMLGHTLYRQIN